MEVRHFSKRVEILRKYLHLSLEDLPLVFPEVVERYGKGLHKELLPFYIAMIALQISHPIFIAFAMIILLNFFNQEKNAQLAYQKHGFSYLDFIKLTGQYDIYNHITQVRKLTQTKQELVRMQNSRSWRWTKPLRWLRGKLRDIKQIITSSSPLHFALDTPQERVFLKKEKILFFRMVFPFPKKDCCPFYMPRKGKNGGHLWSF